MACLAELYSLFFNQGVPHNQDKILTPVSLSHFNQGNAKVRGPVSNLY